MKITWQGVALEGFYNECQMIMLLHSRMIVEPRVPTMGGRPYGGDQRRGTRVAVMFERE